MVNRLKIQLICILETHVKGEKAERIKETILPGWGFIANYELHHLGRIWVCWNQNDLKVDVISKSVQEISCKISANKEDMEWVLSFVYGANKGVDRKYLWSKFQGVKAIVNDGPWLLGGDFNVVLNVKEKWGKESLTSYEVDFNECVNRLEVF